MAEFFYRLKLILWKNYLIRRRDKKRIIIEILWPILLFSILFWIRQTVPRKRQSNCHSVPKALPSVGGVEFIQNVLCSLENPCFDFQVENVDPWNSSIINTLILALEPVLMNETGLRSLRLESLVVDRKLGRSIIALSEVVDRLSRSSQNSPDKNKGKEWFGGVEEYYDLFCGDMRKYSREGPEPAKLSGGLNLVDEHRREFFLEARERQFSPDSDLPANHTCIKFFEDISNTEVGKRLWKIFKIFVRGVIYYAPDNSFTQAVMKKVDEKIKELKSVEDNVRILLTIIERMKNWASQNQQTVRETQDRLKDPAEVEKILTDLNITDSKGKERMRRFLVDLAYINVAEKANSLVHTVQNVTEFLKCVMYDRIRGFSTERQAVAAAMPLIPQNRIWAVISFEMGADGNPPESLRYKIRMDSEKVDRTFGIRSRALNKKLPRRNPYVHLKYITFGYAYLEEMVERAMVEIRTGKSVEGIMVYLQQFPFPCFIFDEFVKFIANLFPIFMVLSWIFSVGMMIRSIVQEKESRLKQMMKVLGVMNCTHWVGWFIENFFVLFISATLLTMILKFGNILTYSDFTLMWFFLLSYAISVIAFSFLLSTFFSRVTSAAPVGAILFFLTHLPCYILRLWLEAEYITWRHIVPACVFSNVAFGFGCHYIAEMEEDGVGVLWANFYDAHEDSVLSLKECVLMLWLDSLLYFLVTLYIEAVFPGFGIPYPWYFLCQTSTYRRKAVNVTLKDGFQEIIDHPFVEPVPDGLVSGVSARGLGKTYSNGSVGLTNFSMDFYVGQITSFLGQNGAGKSTAISILTGLFPPTEGTAIINGCDITKDVEGARRHVGICPQYNVLFDKLTVSEHIIFFSGLKRKEQQVRQEDLNTILTDLGIPTKLNEFPKSMSGGMRKKLCVAIAFTGDSKTIFLDEPTSGVDPVSRRSIWDLLLKYKEGRTIILTTHFMDEADYLGDRIAILSEGSLKACGSSLYLKKKFGQGYSLQMVREQNLGLLPEVGGTSLGEDTSKNLKSIETSEMAEEKHRTTKVIINFVKSTVPEAILASNVGTEISFLLPYTSSSLFSKLFAYLDADMYLLGVESYGISDTSLEEIFLKVINPSSSSLDQDQPFDSDAAEVPGRNIYNCFGLCQKEQYHIYRHIFQPGQEWPEPEQEVSGEPNTVSSSVESFSEPRRFSSMTSGAERTEDRVTYKISDETVGNSQLETTTLAIQSFRSSGPSLNVTESLESGSYEPLAVDRNRERVPKKILFLRQTKAIIMKRITNARRNLRSILFEILLPGVFVAAGLVFTTLVPKPRESASLEATPYQYPRPLQVFFSDLSKEGPVSSLNESIPLGEPYFSRIIDELTGPIGFSTECVNTNTKCHYTECNRCNPEAFNNKTVQDFHCRRKEFEYVEMGRCSCASGFQQCDDNVERKSPPALKTHMNSWIFDASKFVLPEWLLNTYFKYYGRRVGGYEFQVHKPYPVNLTRFLLQLDYVTAIEYENDTSKARPDFQQDMPCNAIKIWFDSKAYISSIAYLNAFYNMALRDLLSVSGSDEKNQSGLFLFQHPLPLGEFQLIESTYVDNILGVVLAICMICSLSFIPASFVLYLIQERVSGGKHLHVISGVRLVIYWVANFTYDMVKFIIPVVLIVLVFLVFDAKAFISKNAVLAFTLLLVLYGWSIIPLMYAVSHAFYDPSTCVVVLTCSSIFVGVVTIVSDFILMELLGNYLEIGEILGNVWMIFPPYCLGRGMIDLAELHAVSEVKKRFQLKNAEPSRFEMDNLGKHFLSLFVQGVLFFIANLLIEYRRWIYIKIVRPTPRYPSETYDNEDEDVHTERQIATSKRNDSNSGLVAQELTKFYRKKKGYAAVDGITFSIGKGECFGLLGMNGSGKTTTFKMLTGELTASGGKALVEGHDVILDGNKARECFGYCPQEDSLDLLLTAEEILRLYGTCRGMKGVEIKWVSNALIRCLGLSPFAHRKCSTYSDGNKRKLSTAVALIGDPDFVFLDEPSTGMDPGARRQLWKVLLLLVHNQKSIVLSTHSMEECEALCTRVGIMANGRFQCLGSPQHLKNRFGTGYTLLVRCVEEKLEDFFLLMEDQMPYAQLDRSCCSQFKFNISREDARLSEIFEIMYAASEKEIIEQYSVSQTTLDDIFIKFSNPRKPE